MRNEQNEVKTICTDVETNKRKKYCDLYEKVVYSTKKPRTAFVFRHRFTCVRTQISAMAEAPQRDAGGFLTHPQKFTM